MALCAVYALALFALKVCSIVFHFSNEAAAPNESTDFRA